MDSSNSQELGKYGELDVKECWREVGREKVMKKFENRRDDLEDQKAVRTEK